MKPMLTRIRPALANRVHLLMALAFLWLAGCSTLNGYQQKGLHSFTALYDKVTVLRDEKGMAYIYADNIDDLLMAQGFVTAQDRLFQMTLTRLFAEGRLTELAGEKALELDTYMRTIGFHRHAKRHAKILDDKTRDFFQRYLDGVNHYIATCQDEYPLEFKLAGIQPQPWDIADSLSILYYMSWNSAANLKTEIITQMLVEKLGPKRAREIFPLNINPDDPQRPARPYEAERPWLSFLNNASDFGLLLEDRPLAVGSNNWAAGPDMSASGKPILANDPHLDARLLPGPWYPCGLITPHLRAVGVNIAGIPGMVIGRTQHIALGMTNAYADAQDLYVETPDPENPDHYLEGERSVPFGVVRETLLIKDPDAAEADGFRRQTLNIRLTRRGPVVSDVLKDLKTDRLVSLRWAPFETMTSAIGLPEVLFAKTTQDIHNALRSLNMIMLNFVFADTGGNIAWRVSGKLPIRSSGGTIPYVVDSDHDNWIGWIPFEEMPHMDNPRKGWVGTCNHLTVDHDFPYYYTSYAAPTFRYRRLKQLMGLPGVKTVADHFQMQQDTRNLLAQELAPVMARALKTCKATAEMGRILDTWDFHDQADQPGPAIFQSVFHEFAYLVFVDELGPQLAHTMLGSWYFWQERLRRMVRDNEPEWFDNVLTPGKIETRDEMFVQAGLKAIETFGPHYGTDLAKWRWGRFHTIEFVSPIRRQGFGKNLLGAGRFPVSGSGETLLRNAYDYNHPFDVSFSDSLRMVADLADNDVILAVLPGGVCGRVFNAHTTDQVEPFIKGEKRYWWFSDRMIEAHCKSRLILDPTAMGDEHRM